ncbi:cation:proton antiporter [Yinghuangia soli]|uniref:Sodium:proton antiporter n=1 Tax=Yinghuangia soli TaxID=2908204 RepID=A0AA41PZU6_9ACTN|nr:sodium:proton antiporter [Yinghuangia soli]MCF2527844.1 sodium:proton antiporter [Yinghuangia soli]
MELTIVAVLGVISIVAVASVSRRLGVAAPLALVVVGIGLSFIPGLPRIEADPEWVLAGVLPPLLYAAAVRMPAVDFRRDFKAIAGLAVLLVAVTTLCTGLVFEALLPGLGLAAAFALGAVVSPTDAVAATSVGKRLGLPSRLLTILEGEGLVNDASALVLLSSAVAAITHDVAFARIGLDFLYAVAAAIAIGVAVGQVNVRVRAHLDDSVLNTAVTFVIPFVAFVPAEEIHASGVLAVVVTGLVTGHQSPRFLRAQDRVTEALNWQTVAFLLESGLFLFMGLQLKTLLDDADRAGVDVGKAVWIGLVASVLVMALRMAFVAPLVASLRREASRAETWQPVLERMRGQVADLEPGTVVRGKKVTDERKERLQLRITRRKSDLEFALAESIGWRGGVVLGWSGMRGAITVAAAQTLPADTPYRTELLLIAFVVAVTTLLVQGLSLPKVIRVLAIPGDDTAADRAEYAALLDELGDRAREILDASDLAPADGTDRYADIVVDRVRNDTRTGYRKAAEAAGGKQAGSPGPGPGQGPGSGSGSGPGSGSADATDPREQYRELILRVLAAEQDELLLARRAGAYSSRTLGRAQHALDIQQARLQQIPEADG